MTALDRRVLGRARHPLDLPIRPGVARPGQATVAIVTGTGGLEAVSVEGLTGCNRLPDDAGGRGDGAACREVGTVVGKHLGRDGFDDTAEEVARDPPGCSSRQLDESELGCAVDGDPEGQLPFHRADLGQIDVDVARVGRA